VRAPACHSNIGLADGSMPQINVQANRRENLKALANIGGKYGPRFVNFQTAILAFSGPS